MKKLQKQERLNLVDGTNLVIKQNKELVSELNDPIQVSQQGLVNEDLILMVDGDTIEGRPLALNSCHKYDEYLDAKVVNFDHTSIKNPAYGRQ